MMKVGGIPKIMVLWQAVFLAASPLVTATPSNLTRLYYNGSAAKCHSTTTQYRQLAGYSIFNSDRVMEGTTDPAANARGEQANGRPVTVEVDSSKLVRKEGVLGFEKSSGFECMTNFDVSVEGYVGDGGHVIGYFLSIEIAVSDPQADATARSSQ